MFGHTQGIVNLFTSHGVSVAMADWYQCTNLVAAADVYDVLGVPPAPNDASCTPLQRAMKLSVLTATAIHEYYVRALGSLDADSAEAKQAVEAAYKTLQGDGRKEYDVKLIASASVACLQCVSSFYYVMCFSGLVLFQSCQEINVYTV